MKSGLLLTKIDHKSFLTELDFPNIFVSDSSNIDFSVSYMLGEQDDYFTVISSSASVYTFDKTVDGSTNQYGQECIDKGWLDLDSNQMISGSVLNIGSIGEGQFVDMTMTISTSGILSTEEDFWCYLRIHNLSERTSIFSRAVNLFEGYKYKSRKYGDGCKYK